MSTWLVIFLLMSLVLNILQFVYSSNTNKDFRKLKDAYDDMSKFVKSAESLLKKHSKTFGKGAK